MKNRKIKGKTRGKNTRRRMRKAKQKSHAEILHDASKSIPQELTSAKTIASTRRAITMLKLLGPVKTAAEKKPVKIARKILLHTLPPKTSIAAVALSLFIAVMGLASSYGQWSQLPLPKSVLISPGRPVALPRLNLGFDVNEAITNKLNKLNYAVSELTSNLSKDDFTISYFTEPAKDLDTQGKVLGEQIVKSDLLCVGKTCITEQQFLKMVKKAGIN